VIVGSNATNFSDNTFKDGDKIACVLTSNDPQRVLNVVASNFLSPKVNPIQINPTLTGEGIVGKAISLNSNFTEKVVWKKDDKIIKNPINGYLNFGKTIAGDPENTTQLYWPTGIFIDNCDNLYISDTYNNRILKFNKDSNIGQIVAGGNGKGTSANQLSGPVDLVVDLNGNIIIADQNRIQLWEPGAIQGKTIINRSAGHLFLYNNEFLYLSNSQSDQIEKFSLNSLTGIIVAGGNGKGSSNNQLNSPGGIFLDKDENLYVTDIGNYRIQKFNKNSFLGVTIAGGNGNGNNSNQLIYPNDLHVLENGDLFVVDAMRIQRFPNGSKIGETVLGSQNLGNSNSQLWHAKNLTFNSKGELFVSDAYNNRIQKKDLKINLIKTEVGVLGLSNRQLLSPKGIALDNNNSLFVSDYGNGRIQKFLPNQNFGTTIYPQTITGFTQPYDLQSDTLNNIYIADASNNRIIKLNLTSNSFSIVAGGNGSGNSLDKLNYPQFFALSKSGNLLISDNLNDTSRIVKWNVNSLQGIKIVDRKVLGESYFRPTSLSLDKNENLYFGANYAIYKLPYNSDLPILVAGTKTYGNGNSFINYPTGIVVDDEENIFFLDNNQVKKWLKNAKNATTIIGDNIGGNRSDQLSNPRGLKFDKDGNIYVSDTDNHRIQKFVFENNNTLIPELAGEYTATISTQFGEFTTPIFKVTAPDSDKDGVEDALDKCPNTPAGEQVDSNGCSLSQKDTDNDGVNDKIDKCSSTKTGFKVDANGCADYQKDSDNDGITDDLDKCQGTPAGVKVDIFGCSDAQKDTCSNVKPILILKNGIELSTPLTGVEYAWYLNEIKIQNANKSTYLATAPGRYSVQVSKSASCVTAISENIFVVITETNQQDDQFVVFPNPFNKDIKMEFPPSFASVIKVSITDIKGSIVYSKEGVTNSEILNLSNLSSGTYFLTIYSNNSSEKRVFKLIKE